MTPGFVCGAETCEELGMVHVWNNMALLIQQAQSFEMDEHLRGLCRKLCPFAR